MGHLSLTHRNCDESDALSCHRAYLGSTWIAIAWQLGPIPIEVSVLYRFLLAAVALFALLTASGRFPRLPWHGQRYAALLGALLFSTNFLCFYHATRYIPSGMSAVIFASASIFNGLNLWLFENKRPTLRWLQGSLLDSLAPCYCSGRCWRMRNSVQTAGKGLLLACCGTLCFSLGNLVSARGQRHGYHVLQLVPWAWFTAWCCCWAGSHCSGSNWWCRPMATIWRPWSTSPVWLGDRLYRLPDPGGAHRCQQGLLRHRALSRWWRLPSPPSTKVLSGSLSRWPEW